ncbi:hypothetical protein ACIPJN_31610 [Streptomyces sp. NPDC086796]|uniref:hypothetical protein n=1 Tax=unclassified Streptomyces TaxID=2593676 RepID=UPI0037F29315
MPVHDQVDLAVEVPDEPSRAAARTAILDSIEGRCGLHPLHSSLGYLGPADYETALAA